MAVTSFAEIQEEFMNRVRRIDAVADRVVISE